MFYFSPNRPLYSAKEKASYRRLQQALLLATLTTPPRTGTTTAGLGMTCDTSGECWTIYRAFAETNSNSPASPLEKPALDLVQGFQYREALSVKQRC